MLPTETRNKTLVKNEPIKCISGSFCKRNANSSRAAQNCGQFGEGEEEQEVVEVGGEGMHIVRGDAASEQ